LFFRIIHQPIIHDPIYGIKLLKEQKLAALTGHGLGGLGHGIGGLGHGIGGLGHGIGGLGGIGGFI